MAREHALYRLYDEGGQLLYVGISVDPGKRLAQHRSDKPWWSEAAHITVQPMATRKAALEAEESAIKAERPRYNVVHNDRGDGGWTHLPAVAEQAMRTMVTAQHQGGSHLETLARLAREKWGLSSQEARLLGSVQWTEHSLNELTTMLDMLLNELPAPRVESARAAVKKEGATRGDPYFDHEFIDPCALLAATARQVAISLAQEFLMTIPQGIANRAVRENTFNDETSWTDAADDARAWIARAREDASDGA